MSIVNEESLIQKSGHMLRQWIMGSDLLYEDRLLKTSKGTDFIITEIEFDSEIPDYIFSKGSLKK